MAPTVRVGQDQEPGSEGKKASRYTVEELAERSGLTSRTIRSYQTQGILPPPEHRGRVAYYAESHLQRLGLISELKERGLSLAEIRDVVRRREAEERAEAASRAKTQSPTDERSHPQVAARAAPASTPVQPDPTAVVIASPEPTSRGRRAGLLAVLAILLLAVAAGAVFVVLDVRHDDAERRRLSREVSDLRGQLSRLGNPPAPTTTTTPPTTAPPSPPPPVPAVPTTVAGPADTSPLPRTSTRPAPTVVTNPTPPGPPPPTPASPRCPTLSILNLCI